MKPLNLFRLAANEQAAGGITDHRKMLLQLLGLPETADQAMINSAFDAAMKEETDETDQERKKEMDKMKSANEKLTADFKAKETQAANESAAKSKAETERDTLKKDKASAEKRATDAEGNFANERQARVKLLVANAVAAGQITGSEVDATEKLLANAKNFDEESDALAKRAKKIHTQSQTGNLNPGSGQEGAHASGQFANEVAREMRESKLSYDQAWRKFSGSDKGKALLAQMHQPKSAIPGMK